MEVLKEMAVEAVRACQDESLVELVWKLLIMNEGGQ